MCHGAILLFKRQSEVENLKEHGVDKGRYLRELSLQSESDEQEFKQMKDDRLKYLEKAVRNYIRCLQHGVSIHFRCYVYHMEYTYVVYSKRLARCASHH